MRPPIGWFARLYPPIHPDHRAQFVALHHGFIQRLRYYETNMGQNGKLKLRQHS